MKESRFSKLSRTELYELASALWWAAINHDRDYPRDSKRSARWRMLEEEVRAEGYRKSNPKGISEGVKREAEKRKLRTG